MTVLAHSTAERFCCPGETYFIDRSIHLARLHAGYPACRMCAHREQTLPGSAPLPAADRAAATACATDWPEGPSGVVHNTIDLPRVRRYAAALGSVVAAERSPGAGQPRVALGGDGRWITAALVAAASEGLQQSGCRVVETGVATTGSLALTILVEQLDGGLLIGNAWGAPQTASLKCWGAEARPWSSPGTLDRVQQAAAGEAQRIGRRYGGVERVEQRALYRRQFEPLFHGLRPLSWALDAASQPLTEHLRALLGNSACRLVAPRAPEQECSTTRKADLPARPKASHGVSPSTIEQQVAYRRRRVERLRAQVLAERLDFGLWVDGDGDTLELVDDAGRQVSLDRLLWPFASASAELEAPRAIVFESSASPLVRQQLSRSGLEQIETAATREALDAALRSPHVALGGGASGRIWFGGQAPSANALGTIGQLLQLLSQTDRPLSAVLAGEPV